MQLTVLFVDGLSVSLSSVMCALRSSFPCNSSTKTPVRALLQPCSARFSAQSTNRHGLRRSLKTSASAQLSQTTTDQRVLEKLQNSSIKSMPCNLVKLYNDTVPQQEVCLGVDSSKDTDMDSLVQIPAAAARASSADFAAIKIVSFVRAVMHNILPRLKFIPSTRLSINKCYRI